MTKCDLNSNFIEIAVRHGSSPVNFLDIFKTPFSKNNCKEFCATEIIKRNQLLCNFIEIALRRGCCPVNLLHIFRTPFSNHLFLRTTLDGCFCK